MSGSWRLRRQLLMGLIILAWMSVSACSGCGEDEREIEPDVEADAGPDADEPDTDEPDIGEPDTDAHEPDVPTPSTGYDPTLDDLGVPSTQCDTEIVAPNVDNPNPVARIFVPSFRMDMDDAVSHKTYRERIHRFVFAHVIPCLSDDYPNVVVFPESMVLPMLVLGDKARQTRTRNSVERAIATMLPSIIRPFNYYGQKYQAEELETVNVILLALTDQLVRSTYDTFGQIADRYDIYVSVTVDLPDFERVTDPEKVTLLGDPDLEDLTYAYEATNWQVKNVQILFGPDGEVVDQTEKTYVTLVELSSLALSPGDFTKDRPMKTPWGRTGVVISKPAWMPDIQERLDDLGTQVIFQPEAFVGGWIIDSGNPDRWEPDVFNLGGWLMAQRGTRSLYNLVPQLTGNFFELVSDSQVQLIEKTNREAGAAQFVGQRGPLEGNTLIAPWVFPDPGEANPAMSLEDRRASLLTDGTRLLPGSGDPMEGQYVEGMWAIDLQFYEDDGIEESVATHPDARTLGDKLYVVASSGSVGERGLEIRRYGAEMANHEVTVTHPVAGYDLIRPGLVAGDDDKLHIVAELIGEDENRLYYVSFDPDTSEFANGTLLDNTGEWSFRPSLALVGTDLYLSYIQRIDNANRASFLRGDLTASAPFAGTTPVVIEPRSETLAELRANQWDAQIAATEDVIVVTWIDFKTWRWEVLAAASLDGGQTWTAPVRIDDVEAGVESIHANPTVISLDGGARFAIAWTSVKATRPNSTIELRRFALGEGGAFTLDDVERLSGDAPYDQWSWRPQIFAPSMDMIYVVFEHLDGAERGVRRARWEQGDWAEAELVAVPGSTPQLVALAPRQGTDFFVVYEDARTFSSVSELVVLTGF